MASANQTAAAALKIKVCRLDKDLPLPRYAQLGDSGLDLYAAVSIEIAPQERGLIPTGIALAIPRGYAGFVLPRSGLASKKGLTLVNSPGLIDSGYRGEVKLIALNCDKSQPVAIKRGERVAQLVIMATPACELIEQDSLEASQRGSSGFGSSGS
jgi:dUTP pyrophosphatase